MECQSFERKVRFRTNNKISLEEYLDFVDSLKQLDLTVNYLNQIIDMHGFKKIYKVPKKVLIEAVNSIDLVDSSRSTLEDNHISSCAFINLEEAIKDLADLKWQECCITSIQTLNSVNYNLSHQSTDTSRPKPNPKRPRKMRKLTTINGVAATTTTAAIDYVSGSPACSSAAGDDCLKKKKKRKTMMTMMKKKKTNDGGFGATVGDQIVSRSSISV